ncbi:MAG TPA: hypothetical protein VGE35_03805 [Candidatus Paceibacterota bacterium]
MRTAFNIGLIICLLFLPWWLGAIVLVAACLAIRGFYEAILYGILADALYGTTLGIHGFQYPATALAVILVLISAFLRDKLAWQ